MKTIGRRILILNIMLLIVILLCWGGTAFADENTSDIPAQEEYTSDSSFSDGSSQDEYTSDSSVSDGSSQDEYTSDGSMSVTPTQDEYTSDGSMSDEPTQDEYTEPGIQDELIISSVNYQDGFIKVPAYYNYIYIDIEYLSSRDQQITITSSDESVISVPTKSIDVAQSVADEYYEYTYINVTTGNCGIAELTFRLGEDEVKIPVIVLPERVNTVDFPEQVGLARQKIQWEPLPGADGYLIKKYQDAQDSSYLKYDEGEIIKSITDGNTASVVVDSSWNEKGFYLVEPYVMFNGEMLTGESEYAVYNAHHFETLPVSLPLKNVKKKTSTSFEISWNISDEAPTYKLYRSNYENNKYKLIGTYDNSAAKSGTITVTDKVKAGNTYFYKLVTVMDGKKAASYSTFASMIPKKLKTKKITSKAMVNSVDFYQYQEGNYTKVVALEGRWGIEPRIRIYTFNKNHKLKSTKTINYIKK